MEPQSNFRSRFTVLSFISIPEALAMSGTFYIFQGDVLTGDAPVVLLRDKDGDLKFAEY